MPGAEVSHQEVVEDFLLVHDMEQDDESPGGKPVDKRENQEKLGNRFFEKFRERACGLAHARSEREQKKQRHHVGEGGPGDKPEEREHESRGLPAFEDRVVGGERDSHGEGVRLERNVAAVFQGCVIEEE